MVGSWQAGQVAMRGCTYYNNRYIRLWGVGRQRKTPRGVGDAAPYEPTAKRL